MPLQLNGTTDRPRLAVFRSNEHIYAQVREPPGCCCSSKSSNSNSQVIDDTVGATLAHASTLSKDLKEAVAGNGANIAAAEAVGKRIAEMCKEKNIGAVAFDRGGFAYHGRVKVS
jgi:large subunit ribosomal protein L18